MLNMNFDSLNFHDFLPAIKEMGFESLIDKDGDIIIKAETLKIITKSEYKKSIKIYSFIDLDDRNINKGDLEKFANKMTDLADLAKFSSFSREDSPGTLKIYCEVNLPAIGSADEAFVKEYLKRSFDDFDKAKTYSKFIDQIVVDSKD